MIKKLTLIILAVIMTVIPLNAYANEGEEAPIIAEETVTEAASEEPQTNGEWKLKKHYFYYYENGEAAKGLTKIGNRTYYFDKNGRQHTGWQKIGKSYYFFNIANGENGYMLTDKKVNKIYLNKSGKAKATSANKKRLKTLVYATKLVEAATKPDMKKRVKLRKCYDYILKNYKYRGSLKFNHTKNWEEDYAYFMYTKKHGSCYHFGATFAFAANACGYKKCYAVSSGGHGWAQVDGKVTDVSWENVDRKNHYFHFDINLSAHNGRPNYKQYGRYKKRI
ncbi:MAG: hypothetical protein IKF64_03665 [Eubacterium sp.]|nr:hypothetical protein [Eubacterium sp.]